MDKQINLIRINYYYEYSYLIYYVNIFDLKYLT